MSAFVEVARQIGITVELKDLGYSQSEIEKFQESVKCPRCGQDLQKTPGGGRWFVHLSNCKGNKK
ncbi:MAG: hypothetical protein GX638_18195 [Crenarchaeota archaeon]|nr:hypothetical protein [Thermoproteota archaeon]